MDPTIASAAVDDAPLVDQITEALRAAGYTEIERRWSSRSVTVSGNREQRTVVLHITDPEPAAGPRSGHNIQTPRLAAIATRAWVPGVAAGSGSAAG
jgi:hypothetical protein